MLLRSESFSSINEFFAEFARDCRQINAATSQAVTRTHEYHILIFVCLYVAKHPRNQTHFTVAATQQ